MRSHSAVCPKGLWRKTGAAYEVPAGEKIILKNKATPFRGGLKKPYKSIVTAIAE